MSEEGMPISGNVSGSILISGNVSGSILIDGTGNIITYQIIQSSDLSRFIRRPLSIFVSSDASQQMERKEIFNAVIQMCGLSLQRLLNIKLSTERSRDQIEEGLRQADLYIWFALLPLGDKQTEEFLRAREIGLRNRLIFADSKVLSIISTAFLETQENLVQYSGLGVLADLISEQIVYLLFDVFRNRNAHYTNLEHHAFYMAHADSADSPIFGDRAFYSAFVNFADSLKLTKKGFSEELHNWFNKLEFEPDTVLIPEGEFWMGSKEDDIGDGDEKPYHLVYLDAYRIAKYPLTVAQFARFVEEVEYVTEAEKCGSRYTWRTPFGNKSEILEKKNHPVVNITWNDASAYCAWLSKATGEHWNLPTDAQWEKAARGTDGRIYPWGNQEPDMSRCNIDDWFDGTTPVGYFGEAGESPYGCADMSGNVWEWCADWYREGYYHNSPGRNPQGAEEGNYRIIRGGSWDDNHWDARCSYRFGCVPDDYDNYLGFRPVLSLADSGS